MRQEISETWTARKAADEARHLASCVICRERLRPREDQRLYAVKNARTREFVHVFVNGTSLEEAVGWPRSDILYSLLEEDGAKRGPPMSDEVKAKLRKASEKRKADNELKRLVRANTPARPVEGEQEEETMAKKKAKISKVKKARKPVRPSGNFDARLPDEFTRKYKGVDYRIVRVADGWQIDGSKTMTIHEAMIHIVEKHQPINKDWKASGFFLDRK